MNDQYKYAERTLTPNIAKELIVELFAGQTVSKQEIMDGVDETHRERGGLPAKAKFPPVTMALTEMKRAGQADNPRRGYWLIFTPQDDDSMDTDHGNLDSDNLEPEKIVGSGKQSVYLYYYPAYQCLAELQSEEVWPCKIGKSRNEPISRIISQTRTALPEYPKVGLIIKTDELNLMETTIQGILRLQGKQKNDAPGNEWFITSPNEVEQIYATNFGYSQ